MRKTSWTTLITDLVEIDLNRCLKWEPVVNTDKVRVVIPAPYNVVTYLPVTSTLQANGRRTWFECVWCKRRVTKLYARYLTVQNTIQVACRYCCDLKYASQYRKDPDNLLAMNRRKLQRLQIRRNLYYAGEPNKFGRQFYKLLEEESRLKTASWERDSKHRHNFLAWYHSLPS